MNWLDVVVECNVPRRWPAAQALECGGKRQRHAALDRLEQAASGVRRSMTTEEIQSGADAALCQAVFRGGGQGVAKEAAHVGQQHLYAPKKLYEQRER